MLRRRFVLDFGFLPLVYFIIFGRLYNSGITQECDVDWMEVKSDFKRWAETFIGLNNDHFDDNITNVVLLISASDIVLWKRVSIAVVGT